MHQEAPPEQSKLTLSRSNRIERQLVAMMLQCPDILPEVRKQKILALMDDPTLRTIGQDALDGKESPVPEENGDESESDRVIRLRAQLSVQQEAWDYRGCMRLIQHFVLIKRRQESAPLDEQIKQAEENHDDERLLQLLKAKQQQVARVRDQQQTGSSKEVD